MRQMKHDDDFLLSSRPACTVLSRGESEALDAARPKGPTRPGGRGGERSYKYVASYLYVADDVSPVS